MIWTALVLACAVLQQPATGPDRSTPARAVRGFLEAARAGDYELAAAFLDAPEGEAVGLARDLHAVLEVGLPTAAAAAPDLPAGDIVVLGRVRLLTGEREIRLARDPSRGWRFDRDTVTAAPEMLGQMGLPWMGEFLPLWLFTVRLLSVTLYQWLALLVLAAASVAGAAIVQSVVLAAARSLARRTATNWDERFVAILPGPLRLFTAVAIVHLVQPLLRLSAAPNDAVTLVVRVLFVVAVTWLALRAVTFVAGLVEAFLSRDVTDENRLRSIKTQIAVPRRIARFVVLLIGTALSFMQFEAVRSVGVSLMASAGLAGLVFGLAAQRTLAQILAGIQLAVTQPIRIGDTVIVAGEWGWIEEIGITYVVVKVWDLRRVVVPVTTFLDTAFQNWTRTAPELLGTVFLHADYTVPVDEVRAELARILESTPLWDRRAQNVQVTDLKERTVELRVLVSAKDGGSLWDLRALVRERLLGWLQERGRRHLPLHRIEMQPVAS